MEPKSFFEQLQLKYVTPLIAIATAIYSFGYTVTENELKTKTQEINNDKVLSEKKIKEQEFKNQLRMAVYTEVKQAVLLKGDVKTKELTVLLVKSLLEENDSINREFKEKLLDLLKDSDSTKAVEKKINELNKQQYESYTIQVFYLEDVLKESRIRAQKTYELLKVKFPNYTIKLSPLSKAQNNRDGYRIDSNQIRYEKAEKAEKAVAEKVKAYIDSTSIFNLEKPRLHSVTNSTPNYISVFVRNM